MKRIGILGCLLAFLALGTTHPASAQEPLRRAFRTGETHRYFVRLTLRTDVEGLTPLVGRRGAYADRLGRFAQVAASWRVTRRVVAVGDDGAAEIEETLDEFEWGAAESSFADDEAARLLDAQRRVLDGWAQRRALRYRETPAGQLLGLSQDARLSLDEAAPPVLTLWLQRALRPTATLPAQVGERWQESRPLDLPGWTNVHGTETGEWLPAASDASRGFEAVAQLHVVQQITGTAARDTSHSDSAGSGTGNDRAAGEQMARFYGESLATLSLADGRLLSATRSALRETSRLLEPVEGLPEPPRFRSRITAQVQMDECEDDCSALRRAAGPRPR